LGVISDAVMAVQTMVLFWRICPEMRLRPASLPQWQRQSSSPPLRRLLAEQQDRRLAILRFAAVLRMRSSRPGAFDRHKAAMVGA